MKVVVASCVFPPEPVVSASTSFDVANFLAHEGHDVQVVCPRPSRNVSENKTSDAEYPFRVTRVFSINSNKSSFFSRFGENISFGISVFFYLIKQKKVDAIYANVWPVFAYGLLVLASKIKGFKVIASVQDLYPESLVAQGRISNDNFLAKSLLSIDRWIARNCHHIIVISEGFRGIYVSSRNVSENKISVIKNWVKSDNIAVLEQAVARKQLKNSTGIEIKDDEVLCVYGGNMGIASGLDVFVDYVKDISPKVRFLFAGDGALVLPLYNLIRQQNLEDRVEILSPWPREMTSSVFCSADILLLPTAEGQEFASVPSKLITYMLSSRPVLLIADQACESAKELTRAECGYVVSERTAEPVISCLDSFCALDGSKQKEMGESGRNYAEDNYSFTRASNKIRTLLSC